VSPPEENKVPRLVVRANESHWDWMGLGSGEWSRWVARWALCAPGQPSQPTNQRWACVPESSLGSSLRTAGAGAESSFVVGPLLVPDPFRCSQSSLAPSLRRSLSLSLSEDSVRNSRGQRGHGRVSTPGSRGPEYRFLFPSRGSCYPSCYQRIVADAST